MSFSEFNEQDYAAIQAEYEALMGAARSRCRFEREVETVQKAFDFACEAHRNVRRSNGEPFIIHPVRVARIVVENIGLGYKSIVSALLHDVIDDGEGGYGIDDIRGLFGEKIASMVDGLCRIKTVLENRQGHNAGNTDEELLRQQNFKKILLLMGDDVRVVLIKMADRLDNCRTISNLPEYRRLWTLEETMYIFIPLAHRLGFYGIKTEMENVWLKYMHPDEYNEILARTSSDRQTREKQIEEFVAPIREKLDAAGISYRIQHRIKSPYSIWRKMNTKNVSLEEIYDLYAVRVIFNPPEGASIADERKEAFEIYVALTSLYDDMPGRMRDWIKLPKSNGYEALHCTLMSRSGIWIEVQIRSKRMDELAEKGIAAHWSYKRNGFVEADSETDVWLNELKEVLATRDINDLELLDTIHRELTVGDIVVFTPSGEQKSIRKGATVLDFAYCIHSEVGDKAIAAKVNSKLVRLSHELKPGDRVEIITVNNSAPKEEWLEFLKTRHARTMVKEYLKSNQPK